MRERVLRELRAIEDASARTTPERLIRFDGWPSIKPRHVVGLLVLAAGLVLLCFGVYAFDWVSASVKEVVSATYNDMETVCLMTGAAAAIAGVVIFDTARTRAI